MACALLLLALALGGQAAEDDPIGRPAENLALIQSHIQPLTHPLCNRLPLLLWHTPGVPTGLELRDVPGVWDVYMARGLLPLCNAVSSVERAAEYLPIYRHLARKGYPIVFLPQGWVQRVFKNRAHPERGCPHQPPARQDHRLACPAYMLETPRLGGEAVNAEAVCRVFKKAGLTINMILIDYESGAYLRNGWDREEKVQEALAEARQCPRCRRRFGEQRLATPDAYRQVVDDARAYTIRVGLCEPARRVFPGLLIGNFYAWPVNRERPRRQGWFSAYGWPGSGMNVAQPRCYIPAGWGGAGRSQEKIDWNTFHYCISSFSRARKVLRDGEMMIPWLSLLHQGRYQPRIQRGLPLVSREAYREMVRHVMLRGAETFAIWTGGGFRGTFAEDFKVPLIAKAGNWVYNVLDVQAAFDEMLAYHEMLRKGKVLNLEIGGEYSRLDATTATWSGVATAERALVRTVSFGPERTKPIEVFGRKVDLPFGRTGRFFWVTPDGNTKPVADIR